MKGLRTPIIATLIVGLFCAASVFLASRPSIQPPRETLALFPMRLDEWRGRREQLTPEVLDSLKLQDYLLANFFSSAQTPRTNLYVAYYGSQKLGSSAHSPSSCIPGGGWEITKLSRQSVEGAKRRFFVNRAIIAKGQIKQLVYYWFDQRGHVYASEYAVKWHLFVDGLLRRRTDGALVRLVTVISADGVKAADERLQKFIKISYPRLKAFVPS